jgi:hypothetical protein
MMMSANLASQVVNGSAEFNGRKGNSDNGVLGIWLDRVDSEGGGGMRIVFEVGIVGEDGIEAVGVRGVYAYGGGSLWGMWGKGSISMRGAFVSWSLRKPMIEGMEMLYGRKRERRGCVEAETGS